LLEAELIKKHQPIYNVKEKDDKSRFVIVITDEKYPRVLMRRERDVEDYDYGPFTSSSQLKTALSLVQKIFPFFDLPRPVENYKESELRRFALKFQTNLYPKGFDTFPINPDAEKEYLKNIKRLKKFLAGDTKSVKKDLQKEMREAIKKLAFEKAQEIQKKFFALEHINDVAIMNADIASGFSTVGQGDSMYRIEAYDVAHMSGQSSVGVMVVFENGVAQKHKYKLFNIKTAKPADDYGALKEILERRLNHEEWGLPNMIIVDGGKSQLSVAEKALQIYPKLAEHISLVSVVKDEKHNARDILNISPSSDLYKAQAKNIISANSEAHRFAISAHKRKRNKAFLLK
jgi:excinuclease ABC subunit C